MSEPVSLSRRSPPLPKRRGNAGRGRVLLVLFGAAISLRDANDITSLLLAAVLQVLASPPASNMLSRATYLAEDIPSRLDVIDEGADRSAGR